jgi:predicted nucleic acid-binding protein
MSKAALDTNVLIQLYELNDSGKFARVQQLLASQPVISSQVVSEFLNVLRRITKLPKHVVLHDAIQLFQFCEIAPVTHQTLTSAATLLARYDFQLFDAIIVASALQAGCTTLYSADFQHNQFIENQLRITNPFV